MSFLIGFAAQLLEWLLEKAFVAGKEAIDEAKKEHDLEQERLARKIEADKALQAANKLINDAKTPEELAHATEEMRKAHEKFLNS